MQRDMRWVFGDHRCMLRIQVPKRATVHESPQLARLMLEAEHEKGPVELFCENTENWGPFGISLIASTIASRGMRSQETKLLVPPEDTEACALLEETGLIGFLPGAFETSSTDGHVRQIAVKRDAAMDTLALQFSGPLEALSPKAPSLVMPCLVAMLDNLQSWSESSVGGFLVLRTYKKGHRVRIALVDRGVGIPAALRRSPSSPLHRLTDWDIIEAACTDPGITSKGEGKTGQGLKMLREQATAHRGRLTVVSLGGKVCWSPTGVTKAHSPAFHGTAIELELGV